ncbi:MAG: phosphoenolpyruvate--protein phosphotransferase [Pseudomonadota bacterium]
MIHKKLNLFEDICRLMTDSSRPEKTLETVVMLVAGRLGIDVCSVYLFDENREQLVLRATYGLNPTSVGKIRMSPQEGLTGLVVEHQEPVFVTRPSEHPRYKFFENSGEEIYGAFLGLPLVYHQKSSGVIVFQTRDEAGISESDLPVFTSIASQIAATVAYTGLLENLAKERTQREHLEKKLNVTPPSHPQPKSIKNILRGVPVSAGIAEGHAHYLPAGISFDQVTCITGSDSKTETKRIEIALNRTGDEIKAITDDIGQLPAEDAAIFESHLMLIRDSGFKKKIIGQIKNGYCAEFALKQVVEKLISQFLDIADPYLRERAADIEDIGKRVLQNLLGVHSSPSGKFEQPTILIGADISAVTLISLHQPQLKGIALSKGGKTSHAAILSKTLEIPMVIGLSEILETVKENDPLILDGQSGLLFKAPTDAILKEYQRLRAEKERYSQQLDLLRDLKAETRDGKAIPLDANIGLLSDLELVQKYGAENIGLYRTEFPFLTRKNFPTEAEQTELYTRILNGANGRRVTIRTLDVGGDKFLSYLDYPKEQNPYLGWRSIRVCLELDEIFRPQLRAILRTSALNPVKLLFPMVSSIKEVRQILSILEEEKKALLSIEVPFDAKIPIGAMVEVPAAAKILNHILDYFDFVSIGTNDLIQYTLAVDRNNPKVAALFNPLHPAVLSTVSEIISTCRKRGKEVSICGEAAAIPKCAYLFTAMGVDRLSMSPAAIPAIKNLIRQMDLKSAEAVLSNVLEMGDEDRISAYLDEVLDTLDSGE